MKFELTDQSAASRTSQSLALSLARIKTGGKQKTTEVVKELKGKRVEGCRGVKGREIHNREREDRGVKGMEGFHIPALLYPLCSLIKTAKHCGRQEEKRNLSDNNTHKKKQQKTSCRSKDWHMSKHTRACKHTIIVSLSGMAECLQFRDQPGGGTPETRHTAAWITCNI